MTEKETDIEEKDTDVEDTQDSGDESEKEKDPEEQLIDLKKDLAEKYIEKLAKENTSPVSMLLGSTGILADYMVSEGLMDKITDKVLIKKILDSAVDKTIVTKIDEIKSKIDSVGTEAELITLQNEIFGASIISDSPKNESTTTEKPTTTPVVSETLVVSSFVEIDGKKYAFPFKEKEKLTSHFGPRKHPITGEQQDHTGIDISAVEGTPIASIVDGEVTKNEETELGGNQITILGSDGKEYYYLHMKEKSPLKVGDRVVAGQEIGLVGNTGRSTGPHLHLTIKEDGKAEDPIALLPDVFDDKHFA